MLGETSGEISQWSEYSYPQKYSDSNYNTRNPTTSNKKNKSQHKYKLNSPSPFRIPKNLPRRDNAEIAYLKTPSLDHLRREKSLLEKDMSQFLRMRKYKSVVNVDARLQKVSREEDREYLRMLSLEHQKQEQTIKQAHQDELSQFYQTWNEIFRRYRQKEERILLKFEQEQQNELTNAKMQFADKVSRVKTSSKALLDLRQQEQHLLKQKRFVQLVDLKQRRKNLKQKLKVERSYLIQRMGQREEEKLKENYRKRYYSLIMRVEDCKFHQQAVYRDNQNRLKQKYQNVIGHLRHEHSMEKKSVEKTAANKSFC